MVAKKATTRSFTQLKASPKCYNCGKRGHIAKNCYSPKKKDWINKKGVQSVHKVTSQTEEEPSFALAVGHSHSQLQNVWLVDSGATQHMVGDQAMLEDFFFLRSHMKSDLLQIVNQFMGLVKVA